LKIKGYRFIEKDKIIGYDEKKFKFFVDVGKVSKKGLALWLLVYREKR
jgi:hypothetical protein